MNRIFISTYLEGIKASSQVTPRDTDKGRQGSRVSLEAFDLTNFPEPLDDVDISGARKPDLTSMWPKLSQGMSILVIAYADNWSKKRALALLISFGCRTTYNVVSKFNSQLAYPCSLFDLGVSYVSETNF